MMRFTGGLPETLCGAGSTLAETEHLRERLPVVLKRLNCKTLLDAPCGDFNWMSQVDLGGIHYIGLDNSVDNLYAANLKSEKDFRLHDIISERLPYADVMLCRDFHQHLPDAMVRRSLRTFVDSHIPWLIATCHSNPDNCEIDKVGGFRPINLMAPPFSFGPPWAAIADPPGSGHWLFAWTRDDVWDALEQ